MGRSTSSTDRQPDDWCRRDQVRRTLGPQQLRWPSWDRAPTGVAQRPQSGVPEGVRCDGPRDVRPPRRLGNRRLQRLGVMVMPDLVPGARARADGHRREDELPVPRVRRLRVLALQRKRQCNSSSPADRSRSWRSRTRTKCVSSAREHSDAALARPSAYLFSRDQRVLRDRQKWGP